MIRRAVSSIIIVALLGAWGWSSWQVHQLRAQVGQLQREVRLSRVPPERRSGVPGREGKDPSWLSRVDAHIAKAGDALSRADLGRAERELAAGADDLRRAARAPAEQTQTALVRAHSQFVHLDRQLRAVQAQLATVSAATAPQARLLQRQARMLRAQARALWPPAGQ